MGWPDHVQLIFDRRVNRRTPSRYRTRVITDGVTPSVHVDYKHSHIKQNSDDGAESPRFYWSNRDLVVGSLTVVYHGGRIVRPRPAPPRPLPPTAVSGSGRGFDGLPCGRA